MKRYTTKKIKKNLSLSSGVCMYRCPEHIDRQQRLLRARTASMDMGVHSFFKGYTDPNLIPCSSIIPRCRPYRASDPILCQLCLALLCSSFNCKLPKEDTDPIYHSAIVSPRLLPLMSYFPWKKKFQFVSTHVTKPIMSSS